MFCSKDANVNMYDRLLRAFVASLIVLMGLFWTTYSISIILYVLAAGLFIDALTGFCGIYKILGISTLDRKKKEELSKGLITIFVIVILIILIAGILVKIFLA